MRRKTVGIIAALAGVAVAIDRCDGIVCHNRNQKTIWSPDRSRKAVLFERECMATVTSTINLSVTRPVGRRGYYGNALIVAAGRWSTLSDVEVSEVSWVDPARLVVRVKGPADVWLKEPSVLGVAVDYRMDVPVVDTAPLRRQ